MYAIKDRKKGGRAPPACSPVPGLPAPPRLRALRPLKTPGFNLPTAAHGSRAKLASLTWPRPSADECSLDDLSSSALVQTRFKTFDFIIVNALLGIFHRLLVFRHRFSLGHAPHALILLFKILMIKFLVNQSVVRIHYTTDRLESNLTPCYSVLFRCNTQNANTFGRNIFCSR